MKTISNYSSFERITSNMAREFGRIKKGTEEEYALSLYPIESNLLKTNRASGVNNGRRAMDAIKICLFKEESIQTWTKEGGASGYFDFLENYLGTEVDGEEMNYVVAQRKS